MMKSLRASLLAFFFSPASDLWLALLRIGTGLELLLYCASLRGDWSHLFASNGEGLISRDLTEAVVSAEGGLIPTVSWLARGGAAVGLTDTVTVTAVWFVLVSASIFLVLGIFSRTSAVVAWLFHLCAVKSIGLMAYGVDNFTTTALFYLMLAPLPDAYSLDQRWRKFPAKAAYWNGFGRRVLQLHVCVIYFFSGLTKMLGAGWWDGSNLWRAMTRAPFNHVPPGWIASVSCLLPAAGILIAVIETTYPVFMGWKRTRLVWLCLVLAMHAGIALTMGLYLFAFIMAVLNLAAFGSDLPSLRRANPHSGFATVAARVT